AVDLTMILGGSTCRGHGDGRGTSGSRHERLALRRSHPPGTFRSGYGPYNGGMSEAAAPLPDDLSVCHGMIRELADSLRAAQRQVEQLGHRLDLLLRPLYGPRSERVDPGQMLLFPGPAEETEGAPAPPMPREPSVPDRARPAKGHGRKAL